MKDQLNAEIKRFASLCAKVRPDWAVEVSYPDDEEGCPLAIAHCFCYDTYSRDDCAAFVFWLLNEFPEVDLRIHRRTATIGVGDLLVCDWRFGDKAQHHVALKQVLVAVNMILEAEAKSE